jgi:hypothetical protein
MNRAATASKIKSKAKQKCVPALNAFWLGLSTNPRTRAHLMNEICAESKISYQHLKGVLNKSRSLSADSAQRFIDTVKKKYGVVLTLEDVILPSCNRK